MDGSMPQMDGFAAARLIRKAEEAEKRDRIPIVAMTAHVIAELAEEWRLAGMDAVIHKPFTIAQLAQCLMDQVPQFQTPADKLAAANDGRPVLRKDENRFSDAGGELDLPLVDQATLGQLRSLNDAKKSDFFKRVVGLYCEHATKTCDQMGQHAKAGEAEACGAVAHSLKSMSLNIGALEVAKIAADFEQMARGDRQVPDQNELDTLSNTLKQTLTALKCETEKYGGPRMAETG
jgi:CheY-like chemotaxis protein